MIVLCRGRGRRGARKARNCRRVTRRRWRPMPLPGTPFSHACCPTTVRLLTAAGCPQDFAPAGHAWRRSGARGGIGSARPTAARAWRLAAAVRRSAAWRRRIACASRAGRRPAAGAVVPLGAWCRNGRLAPSHGLRGNPVCPLAVLHPLRAGRRPAASAGCEPGGWRQCGLGASWRWERTVGPEGGGERAGSGRDGAPTPAPALGSLTQLAAA